MSRRTKSFHLQAISQRQSQARWCLCWARSWTAHGKTRLFKSLKPAACPAGFRFACAIAGSVRQNAEIPAGDCGADDHCRQQPQKRVTVSFLMASFNVEDRGKVVASRKFIAHERSIHLGSPWRHSLVPHRGRSRRRPRRCTLGSHLGSFTKMSRKNLTQAVEASDR